MSNEKLRKETTEDETRTSLMAILKHFAAFTKSRSVAHQIRWLAIISLLNSLHSLTHPLRCFLSPADIGRGFNTEIRVHSMIEM